MLDILEKDDSAGPRKKILIFKSKPGSPNKSKSKKRGFSSKSLKQYHDTKPKVESTNPGVKLV